MCDHTDTVIGVALSKSRREVYCSSNPSCDHTPSFFSVLHIAAVSGGVLKLFLFVSHFLPTILFTKGFINIANMPQE